MKPFTKKIVLSDGREFPGYGFGADRDALHVLVFNTSMVGYQEIMSDPSYTDQAVVMTYPLIGNYGMAEEDYLSRNPSIGAMIVREYNDSPSNFRYTKTLNEALGDSGIPAIEGIDTRMLTRIIRDEGSQPALLTDIATPTAEAIERLGKYLPPQDAVRRVSCRKRWLSRVANPIFKVVVVDCGIRRDTVEALNRVGCNVTVVPYNTPSAEIMALQPDGLLLSNGPGDPHDVGEVVELIRQLRGKLPIFGIGLGHELIALAYGARVLQMKVGHRGANHPVRELSNGHISVTSQNHGYTVEPDSLTGTGLAPTHIDVIDNTIEGTESVADRLFSVQFFPQGNSCGESGNNLFVKFTQIMEERQNG